MDHLSTKSSNSIRDGRDGRKRVLVITNLLQYAIHHRLHLFRRLIDEGYDVVLAGAGSPSERATLEELGVQVHVCEVVPYRLSVTSDLALFPTIRKLVKELRPDVLHLFTIKPILFGKLAVASLPGAARPVALVLSLTGLGRLFLPDASAFERIVRSAVLRVINRPLRSTSQMLTVETHSDKSEIVELADVGENTIVVTNGTGVNFDSFGTAPRTGPITFLFAGRLLRSKGVLSFAEAARQLADRGIAARFLVAGNSDPNDPDSVAPEVLETYRDVPGFEYLGEIAAEQMPELLQKTDVVCLPTRYKEGIPRTLLEAAASGCAFIACRTPGWVETMGEASGAGWFVEPSDVASLVLAMEDATNHPEQTRTAGEIARRVVLSSDVSCTKVQDRYLEAYNRAESSGSNMRRLALIGSGQRGSDSDVHAPQS